MSDSHTLDEWLADRPQPKVRTTSTSSVLQPMDDDLNSLGACRFANRPQMMLGFRTCSGVVEVCPYAMLARIRSENPDRNFELQFTAATISVSGVNLLRLFHYVCEHRAMEIAESQRSEVLEADDTQAVIVDRIEFDVVR